MQPLIITGATKSDRFFHNARGQRGLPRAGLWPGLTLGSTRVPSRFGRARQFPHC